MVIKCTKRTGLKLSICNAYILRMQYCVIERRTWVAVYLTAA